MGKIPQQLRLQAEPIQVRLDGFQQLRQRGSRLSWHFDLASSDRTRTIIP